MSDDANYGQQHTDALISPEDIQSIWKEIQASQLQHDHQGPIQSEPALREFVGQEKLKLIGQLVVNGAPSEVAREAAGQIDMLLELCFNAVHNAHRRLMNDFLPDTTSKREPMSPSGSEIQS